MLKKFLTITLSIIVAVWISFLLTGIIINFYQISHPVQYETKDITKYGDYIGNYDNKAVESFVNSFFPDSIEDHFENVFYSYKAQKGDTYAYEVYLEFTITDKEKYNEFINNNTQELTKQVFYYDSDYIEYVVSDEFDIVYLSKNSFQDELTESVAIEYAKIGKILCSEKEQKIIFVALGVYDGGGVKTDFLNVYFDKFNINPRKYNKGYQPGDGSMIDNTNHQSGDGSMIDNTNHQSGDGSMIAPNLLESQGF